MSLPLEPLFLPKSVAVIGASSKRSSPGYMFTSELLRSGYCGKIYPINPKGGLIQGLKAYKNIKDVETKVDLAMLIVNRDSVRQTIKDCAEAGVKIGVIYTAGFGEVDKYGSQLQENIVYIANTNGMRLVGPNCMGVFSSPANLNLTGEANIPHGSIAMVSQSGNVGFSAWYDAARYLETGFSHFIGFGNQADVPVHDYLEYLSNDPEAKVIVLYIEGLLPNSGEDFLRIAKNITKKKPIVAIKGGRTKAACLAAASHTGSLAGSAAIYSAAFRQAGIIEVQRLDELIPVAQALLLCPQCKSENIAIVGSGGGHMILATDAVENNGFKVPAFSNSKTKLLEERLFYFSPCSNPIDMAGAFLNDLNLWSEITEMSLREPAIGGAFLYGAIGSYLPDLKTNGTTWVDACKKIGDVQKSTGKPIIAYSLAARADIPCNHTLRKANIPVFDSIDTAACALRALREYAIFQSRLIDEPFNNPPPKNKKNSASVSSASNRSNNNMTELEAYYLLKDYAIPTVSYRLASSQDEAIEIANELTYPVVLKISSPEIVHKTDLGGVKVNINSDEELIEAYNTILRNVKSQISEKQIDGVIVAEQLSGIEIIAGIFRDIQFGPVLMVGIGGVFVEILNDVIFSILPVSHRDIKRMLKDLKSYSLLQGVRGQSPVNEEALCDLLYRLGYVALDNPNIAEMDLNPIFANSTGATVADARIIVSNQVLNTGGVRCE